MQPPAQLRCSKPFSYSAPTGIPSGKYRVQLLSLLVRENGVHALVVLLALGAVRLSIGEPTTDDEICQAADALAATWRSLGSDA